MAELKLPATEAEIRKLRVGDFVELTGRMITGRDTAHKWLIEGHRDEVADYLKDTVIYHCGPVVRHNPDGTWDFVAAGPTTSIREEPYQADVIGRGETMLSAGRESLELVGEIDAALGLIDAATGRYRIFSSRDRALPAATVYVLMRSARREPCRGARPARQPSA